MRHRELVLLRDNVIETTVIHDRKERRHAKDRVLPAEPVHHSHVIVPQQGLKRFRVRDFAALQAEYARQFGAIQAEAVSGMVEFG
jgi:hypothetical protein